MPQACTIQMRPEKKRRRPDLTRRLLPRNTTPTANHRMLRLEPLEQRQMLAGDLGGDQPLADITGLWITIGNREYFTSEQASVTVDMFAGETLQITGIRYGLDETVTPEDGVIAFESYVRREHGAAEIGSYDYTDGRFADPVADPLVGGEIIKHDGFDSGWQLDVIDNRVAVVAIRYFGDEFVVEDRLLVDVNVTEPDEVATWTESITTVRGQWEADSDEGIGGDSRVQGDATGLTVIDTGSTGSARYEIGVKAKTVEENTWANGFVVVDYRNENDFVYAGLRSIADKWVIGHFDGSFNDVAALKQDIQPRQVYDLRVAVDGSHVALAADGVFRISHDFDRPLDQGVVGLANQYAFTHFTDFHFFDNSVEPDGTNNLDTAVINDGKGTTITFGNGDGVVPQSDTELAVQEARFAAEQARQASEDANAAAEEAERIHREAESRATQLEAISNEAATVAALADAAQYEARQAVEAAEAQLADASEDLEASEGKSKDNASKAAKKSAKKVDKANEKADKEEKEDREERDDDKEKKKAVKKETSSSRRHREAQQAYDAAAERLQSARLNLQRLEKQAADANHQAQQAAREASQARLSAATAAIKAENARTNALQLAHQAEVASENLAEAELALQNELESRQDTTNEETQEGFVAYSLNFNHQDDGAFDTVAGRSERVAGQLHLVPDKNQIAVSVLDNDALPERTATRVYTTVRADELPGLYKNGFIVFDYQSPDDFKYAGAWAGADRWAIGEVVDGQLVDIATVDEVIGQGPAYELQVWIEDTTLTFLVEGHQKLQHTFEQPIDDGQIGVASYNARSRFDQVAVMQLYGGAGDVGIEHAEVHTEATDEAINELF